MRFMKVLPILILAVALMVAPAVYAGRTTVGPLATVTVLVPANQSINVFSRGGPTKVFKQSGGPSLNTPLRFTEETSSPVIDNEVVFTYTTASYVKISAGPYGAFYNVGALAVANPIMNFSPRDAFTQFAPVTYNTTASFVSSDLMKGLVTSTHTVGATVALTLPTGALLDAASGLKVNQAFTWSLINLSAAAADSITITASSGHTIVGDAVVISNAATTGGAISARGNSTSTWITRKTAADTFITYRR